MTMTASRKYHHGADSAPDRPKRVGQEQFWNGVWERFTPGVIDPLLFVDRSSEIDRAFLARIGDVQNKRVLDLGCGNGLLTTYLAKNGAVVTAVDISSVSINNTAQLARINGVEERVTAKEMDATRVADLGNPFDMIVGRFILHHIEPFDVFSKTLATMLKPGGRAVFLENNGRNPILIFARTYLAGRFGIPKYGDYDESPLEPKELDLLRRDFRDVTAYYPEFVFFKKMNTYVFRHRPMFAPFIKFFIALDAFLYRRMPRLHKYSYNQILELRN